MRIKKLELIGFKSFKDRTVIQFDAGVTGVVGPNGCGKSNIVDALQWVMGEMSAKHLRGSSMEDVIFQGSDGYAPSGMAEVSLVLENDGGPFPAKYMKHSEIQITRRLHRSGESGYLINKEPARLRDIHEIFMDTGAGSKGFSIIEQGAIGKIVTAKPEERRVLIEEAAGITKFKARKRESQRKLQSTDQNLMRLTDIITELKRQLDTLQRQAKKAARYREIKKEAQDLDLLISSKEYLDLKDVAKESRELLETFGDTKTKAEAEIAELESQVQTERLQQLELEKKIETQQTKNGEMQKAFREKENLIQELRFEVEQAKRQEVMQSDIKSEAATRKDALDKEYKEIEEIFNEINEKATQLETQYEELNQRYEHVQARLRDGEEEVTTKRRERVATEGARNQVELQIESSKARKDEYERRTEEAQSVLADLNSKKDEFEKEQSRVYQSLEKERQMQLDIMHDVENFEENRKTLDEQVEARRTEVSEFKDKLNEVSSRLYGLENLHNSFEGFEEGVKSVMMWKRQKVETASGTSEQLVPEMMPVSEVVEVPKEYELAMEAALGTKLQALLTDDSSEVLEAVDFLKSSQKGRSSFLTKGGQSIPDDSTLAGGSSFTELRSVVNAPDKYNDSVQRMLSKVVVVDSIRTALEMRPNNPGWTFVTKEGDTLTPDGILTGGAAESAEVGVLKRRREIKELSEQREEWAGKLSLAQATLKKMEDRLDSIDKDLEASREARVKKEIVVAELKKDLERADRELTNINQAVDRQNSETQRVMDQLSELDAKLSSLNSEMERLTGIRDQLDKEIQGLESELATHKTNYEGLRDETLTLRADSAAKRQEAEGRRRQLDMVGDQLRDVNARLERMSEEAEKNVESISENQVRLEEEKVSLERLMSEIKISEEEFARTKDEYEKLGADLREVDERIYELKTSQNESQSKINEAQLKMDQSELRMHAIGEHIQERYMTELASVVEQYRDRDDDLENCQIRLDELKGKLSRMGEVNLAAVEEYDEIAERYEFLSQQHEDLVNAKEQLRKVIDRINRICNRRFKETFTAVNERFSQVFPVLFGGGEAHLTLIENEDKSEMGIDITARPPGKKPQSVTLLSGGEKALTAVSLIFSIFLVKPSPYCLLDEVDAPLDDANVFRFNDLVNEMSKRSQIILVTHNKHTMEITEKLYGVTMEEKGVSKMVSVDLNEGQAQFAEA